MGWLNRVPRLHECALPSPYEGGAGSVWRCDDCGTKWQVNVHVGGRRRGDHRWERFLEPKDYPPPPVGASGTSSVRGEGSSRVTPTVIPLNDIIAAYHGTGPEIHVTGQPGVAGGGKSGEVHISHGLIIVVPSEAAGALE